MQNRCCGIDCEICTKVKFAPNWVSLRRNADKEFTLWNLEPFWVHFGSHVNVLLFCKDK